MSVRPPLSVVASCALPMELLRSLACLRAWPPQPIVRQSLSTFVRLKTYVKFLSDQSIAGAFTATGIGPRRSHGADLRPH